ncbi:MAG: AMP-binding protein [Bacteroidota bacterium]
MFLQTREKTALVAGETKISYKELIQKVHAYSALFKSEKEARAVIFSENRPGWIYAFYAIWNNGMIPVPVDFMSSAREVSYILNDCQPAIIFTSKDKTSVLNEALKNLNYNPRIIVLDEFEESDAKKLPSKIELGTAEDKTAVIIYTSGTTGNPKGVMLSFKNLLVNIRAVAEEVPIITEPQRVLMLLPLHHVFPLMGTLVIPFYSGSTVAISPSLASKDIIDTLQKNRITILIGVPRLYSAIRNGIMDKINSKGITRMLFNLAKRVDSYTFSRKLFNTVHKKFGGHVKHLVCGGAALDMDVANDYKTLGFEVLEGYGMSEMAPMITFTHPGRVKPGSPGFVLKEVEVKFEQNEILVKGPNLMQGYYNRPEETAEVIKNGWLHTGDLGRLDEQGFLHITGRRKEIIVLPNGKNINPVEIEESLLTYSELIQETAVYQEDNKLCALFVVPEDFLRENGEKKAYSRMRTEVQEKYNQLVSPYKRIGKIILTDKELPRTRLGKLKRYKLDELGRQTFEPVHEDTNVDFEAYTILRDFIAREKKVPVSPGHHLEYDLALDSLDKVYLQVFIEQTFGLAIEPNELVAFGSIVKLAEHLEKHGQKAKPEHINWSEILKEKIHMKLPKSWFSGNLLMKASKYFFHVYFRFKARGTKNIPEGPCIIAPNHQSYIDGLFVVSLLKIKALRRTYFYAKEKHVRKPWLKFLAARNNIIVMDLNNNLKESIQKMAVALKERKNIIIFPEGTRSKSGKLGDFKKTFAILSRELNVPVVPVSIEGAGNALPTGSKFPKPFKRICVEFHPPISPENHSYDSLTDKVKSSIQQGLTKECV